MKSTVLAVALALCAASAQGQMVYKLVQADGRTLYTDHPDQYTDAIPEPEEAKPAVRGPAVTTRRGAAISATEAERRLVLAQRERLQGVAPLGGEREPQAGVAAVNYRYWRRQEKLRRVVDDAQRRANETRRPVLARQ